MKKNGFIATSILYAFFLVFITLFIGLVTAYAHNKAAVLRINEKVREELKGIRTKTLADMNIGDFIRFDYTEQVDRFFNEGKWIVATKSVDSSGTVTITLISDRETPARFYMLDYQNVYDNDYTTYHRGIEGWEKAINPNNYSYSHMNEAIRTNTLGSKKTSINIDFFTVDTLKKVKESDVDDYIKDNIINVGSDYVLKSTGPSVGLPITVNAKDIYSQCFLNMNDSTQYPNGWRTSQYYGSCSTTTNANKMLLCSMIYPDNKIETTRAGYYRFRMYNFGANIDKKKLLQSTRYSAAINKIYPSWNETKKANYALDMYYATYCGATNYDDYLTNMNKYPLSYMSTTYDNEHGVEYVDWCYNAIPYPYTHPESEHVIVSSIDYQRCDLPKGDYSDYIIGIGQSNQSTYSEQTIRLQMTLTIPADEVDSNGNYRYLRDYILAGNGGSNNIYVYTDGVKK